MALALPQEERQKLDALISRCLAGNVHSTLLCEAASVETNAVVEALLHIGLDKNGTDRGGRTALVRAAQRGNMSIVNTLLSAGADVNIKPRGGRWDTFRQEGFSALHWASYRGNNDMVVALLDACARKDTVSPSKSTALFLAAREGHLPVVNTLLSRGADVTLCNRDFETALSAAAEKARHDIVEAVLRNGANVNAKGTVCGGNSLHIICRYYELNSDPDYERKVEITVSVLLRWGADERALNDDGNTPADLLPSDPDNTIRLLLARAPADKAWYRRGWLVMLRSRALKEATPSTQRHRGKDEGNAQLAAVVRQLVGLEEDDVFRTVASFL